MLGGSIERKSSSEDREAINLENVVLTQDFKSLHSERPASSLPSVQSVSPLRSNILYVCILALQHQGKWISLLSELMTLIEPYCSVWKAIATFVRQQGRNKFRWLPGQEASLATHVRNWGRSEANVLYWRKCLRLCRDFGAAAVIRRPPQWFDVPKVIRHPGNCAALVSLVTSLHVSKQLAGFWQKCIGPKNMSQFGHNLRKGRLVNDATTSFNTTVLPDKWPRCLRKKTGGYSNSSRNYDLTVQFCNTSLRQREQRSVALNHDVVARRASTNRDTHNSAANSYGETLAKYQLSTAWWNDELAVRGHDNFCSTVKYLQFKIWEEYASIAPLGYAPGNSDWWRYGIVLILLLQVQTSRQLTPATKRKIWHG